MDNIWYMLYEDGEWVKLKYRPDLSDLSDVFEFMEDIPSKRFMEGKTITMDYGCMGKLIDKGELKQ